MTRDEKITEILTLIDLPPREFLAARVNYEKLTDIELDARLARLRAGSAVIAEWRKHHRLITSTDIGAKKEEVPEVVTDAGAGAVGQAPRGQTIPVIDAIAKSHAAASIAYKIVGQDRTRDAKPRGPQSGHLPAWVRQVREWREELAEKLAELANIVRKLDTPPVAPLAERFLLPHLVDAWELTHHGRALGPSSLFAAAKLSQQEASNPIATELARLGASNELLTALVDYRLRAVAAAINHPSLSSTDDPRMTTGEFIDAFSRVVNVVDEYRPDVFVTLNQAHWVGRLLKDHLGLKTAKIVTVHGSAATNLDWGLSNRLPNAALVCVVGDAAWTGATLSMAIAGAREHFQTDRVFGVVLAASMEAERFEGARDVQFHLVGETRIKVVQRQIRLKHNSPTDDIIDATRRVMRRRYPVAPMPWDISH